MTAATAAEARDTTRLKPLEQIFFFVFYRTQRNLYGLNQIVPVLQFVIKLLFYFKKIMQEGKQLEKFLNS